MAKELNDSRFIIPLRLESGKKVKGVGDAVTVDFVRGWGEGVGLLLDALQRQKVPHPAGEPVIDPNWEIFRRRGAVPPLVEEAERLTSNWLRVAEAPAVNRYFESSGAIEERLLDRALEAFPYPCAKQGSGIITFAEQSEVDTAFESAGRFKLKHEIPLLEFVDNGFSTLGIERQVASNLIIAMIKKTWLSFCSQKGFVDITISTLSASTLRPHRRRADDASLGQARRPTVLNASQCRERTYLAVRRHRDALLLAVLASEAQIESPLLDRQQHPRGA
jgi:hypothetical protein